MILFKNISLAVDDKAKRADGYLLSPTQSLGIMIKTALGSRVMRPTFGSAFYKLLDKTLNDVWVLRAKKAILECTRCSVSGKLWDERVDIEDLKIDLINDEVTIEVKLK